MARSKPARIGRPPLPPTEGKRVALGLRTTAGLRRKIDKAARIEGRSISQEAELRLERSFDLDDARTRDFGDDATLKLMRALAMAKMMTEAITGNNALKDPGTAEAARNAMVAILDAVLPTESRAAKDEVEPSEGQTAILTDPNARSLSDNVRDAILEGLGPNLSVIRANLRKLS